MKHLFIVVFLLAAGLSWSQTKVELNVEDNNGDETIKLHLERQIDGETVVTDKTYASMEELKNDPELEGVNLNIIDGNMAFISDDNGVVHVNVEDEDGKVEAHKIMIASELDDNGEKSDVKVWTDDDGKIHVIENGIELSADDVKQHVISMKANHLAMDKEMNVEVTIDENGEKHVTVNGKEVDANTWVEKNKEGTFNYEFTSDDGKGNVVLIVEDKNIEIKDANKEDEKAFGLANAKELKLDELNYYPNPSKGKLTLAFKGKAKPTLVKITDTQGKIRFEQALGAFAGSFSRELDLSDLPKGMYLLQVTQGNKSALKKIIIE